MPVPEKAVFVMHFLKSSLPVKLTVATLVATYLVTGSPSTSLSCASHIFVQSYIAMACADYYTYIEKRDGTVES